QQSASSMHEAHEHLPGTTRARSTKPAILLHKRGEMDGPGSPARQGHHAQLVCESRLIRRAMQRGSWGSPTMPARGPREKPSSVVRARLAYDA
ncbi:MAG: hypothetical protein M3O50_20055, partial [Myxococcota bacterium]|nr:hypothetical protein [Myxococcota bacterium]